MAIKATMDQSAERTRKDGAAIKRSEESKFNDLVHQEKTSRFCYPK